MSVPKIVPVSQLTANNGIKCIVYGGPGTAKTPLAATAPNPLLLSIEPGTRSLGAMNLAATSGRTVAELDDFFAWCGPRGSREVFQFQTIAIDSISHMCEVYLLHNLTHFRDGRKAYGEMGKRVREIISQMINMPRMNVYMIAKLGMKQVSETGQNVPLFPGQDLGFFIPHELDFIWYISRRSDVPGVSGEQLALQCHPTANTLARSRMPLDVPQLNMLEPPHLGQIFRKIEGKP
ncbi:AAA domain [Caudoviricetes sp.]|nr:AAA domain [Caudoviricetes sp.]